LFVGKRFGFAVPDLIWNISGKTRPISQQQKHTLCCGLGRHYFSITNGGCSPLLPITSSNYAGGSRYSLSLCSQSQWARNRLMIQQQGCCLYGPRFVSG